MEKEFDFTAYRHCTLVSLKHFRYLILLRMDDIKGHVRKFEDKDGTWTIMIGNEDFDDMVRLEAELKYLNKWIRIRTIWRPRDWWNGLQMVIPEIQKRLEMWRENRENRRISKMSEEQKKDYYRAEVRKVEKKLSILVPEYNSDCSWEPVRYGMYIGDYVRKADVDKVKSLLVRRQWMLDKLFRATPEEVKRLENLNEQLQSQSQELVSEMTNRCRQILTSQNLAWEQSLHGAINCDLDVRETMVSVNGDEYYGSDFAKMLELQLQLQIDNGLGEIFQCSKSIDENDRVNVSNEELKIIDPIFLDDDWKDGNWRSVDAVSHIRFSHALHHLYDHMGMPMIDILHLNAFYSKITQESYSYTSQK